MRQTDNKEILIRLLSNYEKELDKINSYRSFKKFGKEKSQLILFIDNWQKCRHNEKYLFTNIAYKSRKRIIYQTCFWLCAGICFIAIVWRWSLTGGKYGPPMSKTLHPISYSIGHKLDLISAIAAVVTYLVYKVDNRKYQKELATKIRFDTYKDLIQYYMKRKLKETPWQEVNAILKKMKDDGVEFPEGYNFNV